LLDDDEDRIPICDDQESAEKNNGSYQEHNDAIACACSLSQSPILLSGSKEQATQAKQEEFMARDVTIEWAPGKTVTGRLAGPARPQLPSVLLAHGAGAGQDHPGVAGIRDRLAWAGVRVLTFNYPYTEAGKRRPDAQTMLLNCHRAALAWLQAKAGRDVVLAGRSMGGRMGTFLAAEGETVRGLVLYAYPLHPAGKPDRIRAEHLADIVAPMLFFSGTRDSLARRELVEQHLRPLPNATIELIDDADHSFRVPKRTGRTFEEVFDAITASTVEWLERLG
jgi:predicted alpha/beta-hydrolase family hydrolase